MYMEEEAGNVLAVTSAMWRNKAAGPIVESMDCNMILSHQTDKAAKTVVNYGSYDDKMQAHILELSSNIEGMHSLTITCCNPLVASVLGKNYRKTMCATTQTEEPILLDATVPTVPSAYAKPLPTDLLKTMTTASCQPVSFDAFADAGGVVSYSVHLNSQEGGEVLAKATVASGSCNADNKDKSGACKRYSACVPLSDRHRGAQGIVSVTAVDRVGLMSSANVARFMIDQTAPMAGRLDLGDITAKQASLSQTKVSFTAFWRGVGVGSTPLKSVRACGQVQELLPHSNASTVESNIATAFAIEANRRVRRKLKASVDRHNDRATMCVDVPPSKTSHTFELTLSHSIMNHLSRYAVVAQTTVISESGLKSTRIAHKDIRAFAPFGANDTLTDSWADDIDFTADTQQVMTHFRSMYRAFGVYMYQCGTGDHCLC